MLGSSGALMSCTILQNMLLARCSLMYQSFLCRREQIMCYFLEGSTSHCYQNTFCPSRLQSHLSGRLPTKMTGPSSNTHMHTKKGVMLCYNDLLGYDNIFDSCKWYLLLNLKTTSFSKLLSGNRPGPLICITFKMNAGARCSTSSCFDRRCGRWMIAFLRPGSV